MKTILVTAAVAVLALPASATAKEISSVTVCGASGCRTIQHPSQDIASGGDGIADPAPALAPFHTVRFTVDHEGGKDSWQIFYVPQPAFLAFRGDDGRVTFERLEGDALAEFRAATRGVDPYPAPAITRATVAGKEVADPASYARPPHHRGRGFAVVERGRLRTGRSPLDPSDALDRDLRYLMFSPSTSTLERGVRLVALPEGLAAAIASGVSLDGAAGDGGGFSLGDSVVVPAALLALLAIVGAVVLAARRGRRAAAA